MATYSSTLAWKISWTEEPGGLQSMGWQRVRHNEHAYVRVHTHTHTHTHTSEIMGFPGGPRGKEPVCQCRRGKRSRFSPSVGKIPWRTSWQPTPVFLPGESHGWRSLAGYGP